MESFEPDYRHVVDAARNIPAKRTPLYEHGVDPTVMGEILGREFAALRNGDLADRREYFTNVHDFHRRMGYDTVSFEAGVTAVISGGLALRGQRPGDVQNRADFEAYPFDEVQEKYFQAHADSFQLVRETMPPGMKAVGGVGNGVFEITQDLVGYPQLCLLSVDDPQLYAQIFATVGDILVKIWTRVLDEFGDIFAVCRIGDDLGFKSSTLLSPDDIRTHILPQYRRVVDLVHAHGKPFLLHCCGNIFEVMDDIIDVVDIDAKHSNEDQIAPFSEWVDRYSDRIGLFGGVDMDLLCRAGEDTIRQCVTDVMSGAVGRCGLAVGSGNSIPNYVPASGYLAMIEQVRKLRGDY